MNKFHFNTSPKIRFGCGIIKELGDIVQKNIGKNVLFITDPGLLEIGLAKKAINIIQKNGINVSLFSDVEADPSEKTIYNATEKAKDIKAEGIIGFGGGSSMDVAKLTSLLVSDRLELKEIYGIDKVKSSRIPLILIPTTSGTGSEVTPIAIVTTSESEKMGVVSSTILPDMALLDPELTTGLPPHITAATGIDAMVHAIEAYTSKSTNNNPISKTLAIEALRLMGMWIEKAVHTGENIEARSNMLLGSMLAGQAFANSPVAAVHALAYPIGGHFKVPHGLSNALVLPHVIRFNALTHPKPYSEIAPIVFSELHNMNSQEAAKAFSDSLALLSKNCGLQQNLREVGIKENDLPILSKDAMNQSRLLVNNPRVISEKDAYNIYKAAL